MKLTALFAALLVVAAPAIAQTADLPTGDTNTLRRASVVQLKSWYLACDRISRHEVLDAGTAAQCSVAAEALLQREFGGDFQRLIAWWREQPTVVAAR